MEQRDLIKDQIEQLTLVLGRLMSEYFEMKIQENVVQAIKITKRGMKSELAINIDNLILLAPQEIENYIESKKLTAFHLDELAKFIFEIGSYHKTKDGNAKKWFDLVKNLLEIADKKSKTTTFGRVNLRDKIENELLP